VFRHLARKRRAVARGAGDGRHLTIEGIEREQTKPMRFERRLPGSLRVEADFMAELTERQTD
jgi:hypothetical protein